MRRFVNRTPTVKVKDLCRSRWAYRHGAYEDFSLLYTYLVDVTEAICDNDTSHGQMDWYNKTIVAANPKCTILSPSYCLMLQTVYL